MSPKESDTRMDLSLSLRAKSSASTVHNAIAVDKSVELKCVLSVSVSLGSAGVPCFASDERTRQQ
jgi:hypothetical protein